MKINRTLLGILIFALLFSIMGCKEKEITLSGVVIDKETNKGIPKLELWLDIVNKETKESSIVGGEKMIKTDEEGKFIKEEIHIYKQGLKSLVKNKDKYECKMKLSERFCYPSNLSINLTEIKIDLKKMQVSSIDFNVSYGAAITGKVVDVVDEVPIPNVEISLIKRENAQEQKVSSTIYSDSQGEFKFECVKERDVELKCIHPRYDKHTANVSLLRQGEEKKLELIKLRSDINQPIFTMPLSYRDLFRIYGIPDTVKDKFREKNYPLSNNAMITRIIESGTTTTFMCRIIDRGTNTLIIFDIKEMNQRIGVYREIIRISPDSLPDPNGTIAIALNQERFPKELRNVFTEREMSLPPEIEVRAIVKDNMWIIGGEWLYTIIKIGKNITIIYGDIASPIGY